MRVVQGSQLLTAPVPSQCVTGGYEVVLQVTGDPLSVLRGYGAEFAARWISSEGDLRGDDEFVVVRRLAAGGGILEAVAVLGPPTFVLVHRCND
jgi:hypothetical protein